MNLSDFHKIVKAKVDNSKKSDPLFQQIALYGHIFSDFGIILPTISYFPSFLENIVLDGLPGGHGKEVRRGHPVQLGIFLYALQKV